LLVTDTDGYCVAANEALLSLVGRVPEQMIGMLRFQDLLTTGGRISYQTHLLPMLRVEGSFQEVAMVVRSADGEDHPVLITASLKGPAGAPDTIHFAIFKAEQRRLDEPELSALRAAEQTRSSWLRQVEALADVGAWMLDTETGEITWSDQMFRLFGLPVGPPPSFETAMSFFPEPSRSAVARKINDAVAHGTPFEFDADLITAGGERRRVRSTGEPKWSQGKLKYFVGVLKNITRQHEIEQRLWRSAHIDALAGIANRQWFQQRLAQSVAEASGKGQEFVLMLLDLDGFKEINDTLGHQAGDEVVRVIAPRIGEALGPDAFTARIGGDEFAVILPVSRSSTDLRAQAEKILAQIRKPVLYQGVSAFASGSIGIACFPHDADTPEGLLRCADMALYKVKRSGRGTVAFFGPELSKMFDARRRAIEMVRQAAQEGRIIPHFQPKIRMEDRSVYGFEALARIRNSDGTISGPGEFWAAFNDPESARQISVEMLRGIVRCIATWRRKGLDVGVVSFNASEFSFQRGDFAQNLLGQLDRLGIPPASVEVEITETVFLGDDAQLVQAALEELHAAGVSISLDDFGTGYASLTHLRDFPIDTLKIDRSFVHGLKEKPQNASIIRGIIDLAHNLGIQVVAEGVETEDQYEFLRAAGCDNAQGYLFGKPVPAREAQGYLLPLQQNDTTGRLAANYV
jgi:diguanylate cyclase (GGDEF)-like protein